MNSQANASITYLLLDPAEGTLTSHVVTLHALDDEFRRILNCELLQSFTLTLPEYKNSIDAWIDEEGLSKSHRGLWIETHSGIPYLGKAIFTGAADDHGHPTSCPLGAGAIAAGLTAYYPAVGLNPFHANKNLAQQIAEKQVKIGLSRHEAIKTA